MAFSGNSVGNMATYTCVSGFELIGDSTTTCTLVDMDSSEFQPAPPSCRREFTDSYRLPGMVTCQAILLACENYSSVTSTKEILVHLCAFVYA